MHVHVLFFGRLKEIVGKSEEDAEVSDGARVEDLFAGYGRNFPELAQFRSSVVASVNQEFAEWRATLASGDEVAFLPPVSGGSIPAEATVEENQCILVRQPIATSEIVAQLKAPADGAVVMFEGIVRDHSGNRSTLYLEYEAYQAMALGKMREIGTEMMQKYSIRRYAMIHRLGRLEIGETAVLIVVCSAHRAAAFDACRYGIDTLKRNVPIWKKEFFPRWCSLGRRRNPVRVSNPFCNNENLTLSSMNSSISSFHSKSDIGRCRRAVSPIGLRVFLKASGTKGVARGLIAVLLMLAAQIPARAKQPDEQDQRGRIRSEVSLVSMLASVLDKDNRPVINLTADQFELYEEGVKQKVEVFEPETQVPLDLALMIDSSLSEIKELGFEGVAASHFIQKLVRPADRLAVYEFADAVTLLAPFSSNVPALQSSLKRIVPGDGTALYDAVYLGAQALGRNAPGRRKVIVLVTDAGETTSRADFETARRAALRADVLLYTIVIRAVKTESGRNTAGEHAMETIADTTGGATYFPNDISELGAMFDLIDRELRTQYRIAYYPVPKPPAGEYRNIELRATCDCKVRSRKAYYSGGHLE